MDLVGEGDMESWGKKTSKVEETWKVGGGDIESSAVYRC